MNIAKARELLTVNPKLLTFEQLLKHRVRLIDAWRESKADYGMVQAVKDGFYKEVLNEYSSGYTPTDLWLTKNLTVRLDEVEELIRVATDTP